MGKREDERERETEMESRKGDVCEREGDWMEGEREGNMREREKEFGGREGVR